MLTTSYCINLYCILLWPSSLHFRFVSGDLGALDESDVHRKYVILANYISSSYLERDGIGDGMEWGECSFRRQDW